ncbi:polyketide synthase [Streptomyces sp. NBC_01304]|uniref:polyketide synthase n=1 Tax=Streptomyces sp. NBC_01304 TaxID=2903818 RepID=UPI002E11A31C|nr:polyketide synthase [Streptomyces sp. NBC_01304]WSJ88604.1 polyketide synthase dehydratase domain-containing protein [Streptomyces sp. NBC_01304]
MRPQEPVAIVGMAVTLPGAGDLETYWRNLVDGVDAISEVPKARWDADTYYDPAGGRPDAIYCRRGGFVDGLADFDPTAFGVMPDSVPGTEPDQLIALRTAAAALADAGGSLPDDRSRVGVVLGRGGYLTDGLARLDQRVRTSGQLVRTLRELLPELGEERLDQVRTAFSAALGGADSPESVIGLVPNFAASRIANRLDLRGPAYTVDAACASSLVALDQAIAELAAGRCDVMLAGGVHHCHDITLWSVFSQLRALSPSGRSRPFHRDADGVLMGEGTGVVVLKRLADAERDGDRVYAVVRGVGVAGDGRAASLVNPDPGGQARAVRLAWAAAGLDPSAPGSLGLLEAHGTGTPSGDGAEMATLAEVFGRSSSPDAVIGSVKSMIGHTMPAAGVAGLVKAALAIHRGVLLPTLHCEDPHPALLETRFRPAAQARPWEGEVRRAAVNAFGFGGINAHVVLEGVAGGKSAPPAFEERGPGRSPVTLRQTKPMEVAEPPALLRLAAATPQELARLLDADDAALRAMPAPGADAGPSRVAILDPTPRRLALARKAAAQSRAWGGRSDVWLAPEPLLGPGGGKTAFLFPGLEADFEPRADDIAAHFGLARPDWQDARVGDVAEHGAAVVGLGRLLADALARTGIAPDAVAGHSVGEWTAMVVGGMFDDAEVDAFLRDFDPSVLRVPGLAFAAFGAPAEQVEAALPAFPGAVLSHDNAPRQSIACGPRDQVEALAERLRGEGVLGQVLPFESGFHTPMLAPYLGPIEQASLGFTLSRSRVPVWSGTTAAPFPEGDAAVRALFLRHLLEPVRFRGLTRSLYDAGFRAFVQLGTGQLPALVGDTLADAPHLSLTANSPRHSGLSQLLRVAAGLWTYGEAPDFDALDPTFDSARPAPHSACPAFEDTARRAEGFAESREGAGRGTRRPDPTRAVPITLGSSLVSLDTATRDNLRGALARSAPADRAQGELAAVAAKFPAAAELHALLTETAQTAAALFAAGQGQGQDQGRPPAVLAAPPAPPAPRPESRPRPAGPLHISTTTMPYLLDHCFFQQPPDWPDLADRWPVLPATTMVQLMIDAVPGQGGREGVTVAVEDARFLEWVVAEPAVDVEIKTHPAGPGRHTVEFGRHARATLRTAATYEQQPAGAPWPVPGDERQPTVSAEEMYDERWMFHGPLFRGVTRITALGDRHVRGVLTAPPAPGALLDNVGQLLGYWLMASRSDRTVVFPVGIKELRLHGPHPAPGTALDCHIRVTALTETVLEADVQLVRDGQVWAEIRGWQDRRFDSPEQTEAVKRKPAEHTLSETQPGDWQLVFEYWPDPASRELFMRNQLAGDERTQYAQHPPRGKRQWLLGRIAAKDAVRRHLWAHGEPGPIYPSEVRVVNEPSGRPRPEGVHRRQLPPLELSLAHCGEAAVALARPHDAAGNGVGVGIDIEEIVERPESTYDAVLAPAERALFREFGGGPEWLTRFWAAKEAAAKAEGTGMGGRPRDFTVVAVTGDALDVRTPSGRVRRVRHTVTANPPGLPARTYAVAWTVGTTAPDAPTDPADSADSADSEENTAP